MERILGITAEYDPFHNGHRYHLAKAKEEASPEAVIAVMSGCFTQRGEPAILDKWTRARIAADQGIDLVLELPLRCACSRAELFASGAVDMLLAAGATHISFGCEAEDPRMLTELAKLHISEREELADRTARQMREGCSFAKATELASSELFGDDLTKLSLDPNNILALEYLKRILYWEERGRAVCPVPVRRAGGKEDSVNQTSGFAGGTAIRKMIAEGRPVDGYLPYDIARYAGSQGGWTDLHKANSRMYLILRGIILRSSTEELSQIFCVGEGMEHRIKRAAAQAETYDQFLRMMVSRRYSAAVIRRVMIYILAGIREMPASRPYGTLLAAGPSGRGILRRLADAESKDGDLMPLLVIANVNRVGDLPGDVRGSLALDHLAADLFALLCGRSADEHEKRPYMFG